MTAYCVGKAALFAFLILKVCQILYLSRLISYAILWRGKAQRVQNCHYILVSKQFKADFMLKNFDN